MVNVVDGDTIDVTVSGAEYRVRYIGIDTPETMKVGALPFSTSQIDGRLLYPGQAGYTGQPNEPTIKESYYGDVYRTS